MNTQVLDTKIELIQWLSTLEDQTIIEKLVKFRQQETKDWWESISTEEQQSIEKGISDAENGKLKPYSIARKLHENSLDKMAKDENQSELANKILSGLEKAYERLIEFKKQKNSELVIFKDGKIVRVKPE